MQNKRTGEKTEIYNTFRMKNSRTEREHLAHASRYILYEYGIETRQKVDHFTADRYDIACSELIRAGTLHLS